tara:strand:+ start:267 stop:539 length:273 start_codon:yes stop_codon:yes gene_type:complete
MEIGDIVLTRQLSVNPLCDACLTTMSRFLTDYMIKEVQEKHIIVEIDDESGVYYMDRKIEKTSIHTLIKKEDIDKWVWCPENGYSLEEIN